MSNKTEIKISLPVIATFYAKATTHPEADIFGYRSPLHAFHEWLEQKGIDLNEYVAYLRERDFIDLVKVTELWSEKYTGSATPPDSVKEIFKKSPDLTTDESFKPGYVYLRKRGEDV